MSTFGKNRSVIGLVTNRTLDPASADYRWVDEGKVVGSTEADDWNAIDANFAVDEHGQPWLAWGSFWGGIKMRRLESITGPYRDRDGRPMMQGGGTPLLEGPGAWRGPGHPAVLFDRDADLLVFHAYDAATGGPRLHISTMVWENGWPRVGRLN